MNTQPTAEQERQQIKHSYGYIRLSSKKQVGDERGGQERQTARAKQIADSHGWQLSTETFADLGTSAFSGKNRLTGNLGKFIELAEQGKLLPHPVLILESWDRYSRDTLDETFESVRKLLKAGIAFHIGYGDRTFTKSSLQSAEQRGEIERALEAAHKYSKDLSDRVSSAKQRKITKVINGEMVNLNDMAPTWATYDKATKTYIRNDKASVVVDIFKQYLAGESIYGIIRGLNTSKTPSFNGKQWCASSLKYVLTSKSVLGEFKNRAGVFPKLIDKPDFDKVQAMLERNKSIRREQIKDGKHLVSFTGGRRGHRAEMVNIFLGVVFCQCGRRATLTKSRANYYYRCPYSKQGTGCTQNRMFPVHLLDEDFFAIVLQQTPQALLGNADTDSKERLGGNGNE